jgi:glutathione S-transferase
MPRLLYHLWTNPAARKIRLMLAEKQLPFDPVIERPWERRPEFLALNPAGEVPVLVEADGRVIASGTAIEEYLDETYPEPALIGTTPAERAECRRLVAWFDGKFQREVSDLLVEEKLTKRLSGQGHPSSQAIRAGLANIKIHLDYLGWLAERRRYLGGDHFSRADITAAAHLSAVDYLGDVPWDDHPPAREWYARVKSRPAFRGLLADQIPGSPAPKHYADLDF